jgi:hypothetical protein
MRPEAVSSAGAMAQTAAAWSQRGAKRQPGAEKALATEPAIEWTMARPSGPRFARAGRQSISARV